MAKQQFGKQNSDESLNICLEQLFHLVFHCQPLFPSFSSCFHLPPQLSGGGQGTLSQG